MHLNNRCCVIYNRRGRRGSLSAQSCRAWRNVAAWATADLDGVAVGLEGGIDGDRTMVTGLVAQCTSQPWALSGLRRERR
jgi:hypothetical protein